MDRKYDSQWSFIIENDPLFTEEALIDVDEDVQLSIKGFFCSGTYGLRSEVNYIREKSILKNTFICSTASLIVPKKQLEKRNLTIQGKSFRIQRVMGQDSGVTVMELAQLGGDDGVRDKDR